MQNDRQQHPTLESLPFPRTRVAYRIPCMHPIAYWLGIVHFECGHTLLYDMASSDYYTGQELTCVACAYRFQEVRTVKAYRGGPGDPGRIQLVLRCGHVETIPGDMLRLGARFAHLLRDTEVACSICSAPPDLL